MRVSDVFPVVVVTVSVLALGGCGGGAAKPPATPQCVLASDCKNPSLQCAQGYCVNVCNTSVDCPSGQRCIATEGGTTCQPPEKKTCGLNSDCSPLFCALDLVCRNECSTDVDCPGGGLANGQKCTESKRCVDPVLDKNYDPATNELRPPGSTGTGGSGSGTGGRGGNSGGGGAGAGSCVTPQTQFGNVAKGDANPKFTSGVGVRAANRMIVFSGYEGPPTDAADAGTDAAVPNVSVVYAQAFSLTGDSLGPAAPLFEVPDAPSFFVQDVSVAPTGEIALLYSSGVPGNGAQLRLSAVFFGATSATTDGGAAGLQVVRTVQLESVQLGSPRVIWSVSSGAFVMSWRYNTTSWFTRIRKFLTNGSGAGGDTSVIPTLQGFNNDSAWDDTQVGTSGKLFASAYRHYSNGDPYMTVLDAEGIQVGGFIPLGTQGVSHWVSTGGTTNGFVAIWNSGANAYGVFLPTTGATSILDGGAPTDAGVDAGDAGAPRVFDPFMYPTTATTARMVSDDTGGVGGVGAVLLESNGTNFLYVTADGSKRLSVGTVISSAAGVQTALTNYHGSFGISLYESTTHATQVVASGCGL